jgi:hypothetical protein
MWTRIFFWSSAVSALTAFWWAVRRATVPTPRLVEWSVFTLMVFVLFVVTTLRTVRQLATAEPAVAQQKVLVVSAIGLILMAFALRLR